MPLPWSPRTEVVLVRGQVEVARRPLTTGPRPDLALVGSLARLQLAVRRRGCSIRLRGASEELSALLRLAGLVEVVPVGGEPLQRRWQPEGGEQAGVEEVVVPDDPVT